MSSLDKILAAEEARVARLIELAKSDPGAAAKEAARRDDDPKRTDGR